MVRSLLLFFSLPIPALAETIQNRWKVPDGGKTDLSQTFTSGQTLPVSWKSMNESTNDLWVTTWNYNEVQYSSLIARNIDISVDGSYAWTIGIPSSQLSKSAKYVLRFKKPGTVYKAATVELSSPAFLVLAGEAAAPSSAITSSPTQITSTTSSSVQSASSTAAATASFSSTSPSPSISTSPSPSPSSSPSQSPSPSPSSSPSPSQSQTSASAPTAASSFPTSTAALSSLSLGAKIGIGVGIAAVVLALASLLYWLCCCCCRRRRSHRKQEQHDGNDDRKYQRRPQWATEGDWTGHHAMEMYHVNGGGSGGGGRGKELTALPELPGETGPRRW